MPTNDLYDSCLTHHGVKGMKWGVRKRARVAARLGDQIKFYNKAIDRYDTQRRDRKFKGKSTDKIEKRLSAARAYTKKIVKARNKLVSGLTKKEIQRGERFVKASDLLLIGGVLPRSIIAYSDYKYIENNS